MLRSLHRTPDIVTIFHKAGSPASSRVVNLLKQLSANTQAGAITMDQASDTHSIPKREPFELNITEGPPTTDQLQTILGYVGKSGVSTIVRGARDAKSGLDKFRQNSEAFLRPVTVDWNNGRAVAGDNDSEILRLLHARK